jgi:hypothetical protein
VLVIVLSFDCVSAGWSVGISVVADISFFYPDNKLNILSTVVG